MYNIDPTVWGPHLWKYMHLMTLSYPDTPTTIDKDNFKAFFLSLQNVLPCENCRENFKSHLIKYPLNDTVLSSRYNLVVWLMNIHNEVNKENNKKIMTYDELINEYTNPPSSYNKTLINILLILGLIIVLIIYAKYY